VEEGVVVLLLEVDSVKLDSVVVLVVDVVVVVVSEVVVEVLVSDVDEDIVVLFDTISVELSCLTRSRGTDASSK